MYIRYYSMVMANTCGMVIKIERSVGEHASDLSTVWNRVKLMFMGIYADF